MSEPPYDQLAPLISNSNPTYLPSRVVIVQAFEDVYNHPYAVNLYMHNSAISPGLLFGDVTNISIAVTYSRERMIVSTPMFIVATVLLVYTTLLLGMLYWGSSPLDEVVHEPSCLAGTWAALYTRDAKAECAAIRGRPLTRERNG